MNKEEKLLISETLLYRILVSIITECFDDFYVEFFEESHMDDLKKEFENIKKTSYALNRKNAGSLLIGNKLIEFIKEEVEKENE